MLRRWFAFGVFGLEVHSTPWAKTPWLFRDVTVMSAAAETFLDRPVDKQTMQAIESAFGLVVWTDGRMAAAMRYGHLIRQPHPTAFIVVKKKVRGDDDREASADAALRAREVGAMLCLTRTFCTTNAAGILDATSLPYAPRIGLVPKPWIDPEDGRWGASQEIVSPGWLREPDVVGGADLVDGVRRGVPMTTVDGRPWAIAEAIPLVRMLTHHRRTPAELRVVRASLQVYRAHHAGSPDARLLQSVVGLEALFEEPTDERCLMRRVKQLVQLGSASREVVERVFALRRTYLFGGQPITEEEADMAVHLAASAMHAFAEGVDRFHDAAAVTARLDLLAEIDEATGATDAERREMLLRLGPIAPNTTELFRGLMSGRLSGPGSDDAGKTLPW